MVRVILLIILLNLWVFGHDEGGLRGLIDKRGEDYNVLNYYKISQVSKPVLYKNGLLFTFMDEEANEVFVSGTFSKWEKRIPLVKNKKGIFFVFLENVNFKKGLYHYRYIQDSFWLNDPKQDYYVDDGLGIPMTAFYLEKDLYKIHVSPELVGHQYFRFYLEDKDYEYVSWVGGKNNWDPYVDVMKKIGDVWIIVLKIDKNYTFYNFYVDGKFIIDPQNFYHGTSKYGKHVSYIIQDLFLEP